MNPGSYNFTIYQGASLNHKMVWQANGVPVNLTGYTARLQARKKKTDTTVIINLTSPGGITLGGASGEITLVMSATETAALDFNTVFYDLELVNGSTVYRLIEGQITLSREVTR